MLKVIFLVLIAMFAVAGIFISMEAKRRGRSASARVAAHGNDAGSIGQAASDND
jgi:hypothetical protein